MVADRSEVTGMIRAAKVAKNIKWADVAAAIGKSKEWAIAACLGQTAFTKRKRLALSLGYPNEAIAWLQVAPYKGSVPTAVPTDPLIYRWYEIVISREADRKGDRVKVVMSGKFLPYETY
jgi:cyanate lyase